VTAGNDTRDRILVEAASLFSARGFNGTSMSDLAAAVGITKSSLYHHFPSKQALLSEIIELTVNRVTPLVREVADLDLPAGERLRRAVRLHTVEAIRDHSPDFMATHLTNRNAYEQLFRGMLHDGIDSGEFIERDVGIAAKAVLGMCNSVVRWFNPGGDHTPEEIADEFSRIAVQGMTASPMAGGDR
jgi:AcrR family transcriptional regulator